MTARRSGDPLWHGGRGAGCTPALRIGLEHDLLPRRLGCMGTVDRWLRASCWAVCGGALAVLGGCRSRDSTLIVGVQSDPMGGIVSALHVVVRVAGTVVDDERIQPPRGSRVGFPQPWEKPVTGAGAAK